MAHPRALHRVAKQGCILTTRTLCPTLPSSSTVPIARCGLLPSPLHAPTAQQQTAAPHHHRMLLHTSAAAADASTPVATAPSMASRATSPAWGALLGFAAAAAATATTIATASEAPAAAQDPYAPPTELHGMPTSLVLYQYEVCPFCCKVKAFLDYYNIPYSCIEVNPLTKKELKWSDYKKVPVVLLNGTEQVNDSSRIISRLYAEMHGTPAPPTASSWWRALSPVRPSAPRRGAGMSPEEEATWRRWVDARFVRTVTVNIYRNAGESWQTFNYITHNGNFSWAERQASRVAGATMMWAISGSLQKKYGIQGDLRQHLYDDAAEWVAAVGDRPFAGGASPNMADLAVFGVIRSVVGTDTFRDLMLNTGIAPWYERMFNAVGDSARVPLEE